MTLPGARFPAARREAAGDGAAVYELDVAPGLLAFQGHFPDNPILPGVVQVDWAMHFATEAFGPLGTFSSIRNLKFLHIIRPGAPLSLHLGQDPDGAGFRFTYRSGDAVMASGSARFTRHP